MKSFFKSYGIATLAFSSLVFFSSCSKTSYTSILSDKMIHQQSASSRTTDTKTATAVSVIPGNNQNSCTISTNDVPVRTAIKAHKEKKDNIFRGHKSITKLAQVITLKTGNFIEKQKIAINNIKTTQHTASVSGTHHTQSWLGAAVAFLIIGLILTFLGFGALGSLFWAIGIVLIVVAIVFFILWLLAAAVN
jgi:hypothetical protein